MVMVSFLFELFSLNDKGGHNETAFAPTLYLNLTVDPEFPLFKITANH